MFVRIYRYIEYIHFLRASLAAHASGNVHCIHTYVQYCKKMVVFRSNEYLVPVVRTVLWEYTVYSIEYRVQYIPDITVFTVSKHCTATYLKRTPFRLFIFELEAHKSST